MPLAPALVGSQPSRTILSVGDFCGMASPPSFHLQLSAQACRP
ncbi:hypothetical protein EVA_07814 [gut metagenome]|uniref:Uncharacterized protein n=1 Tax=gut metagenome TaxID=749906 RepID=J9GUH5_9ZZZZ